MRNVSLTKENRLHQLFKYFIQSNVLTKNCIANKFYTQKSISCINFLKIFCMKLRTKYCINAIFTHLYKFL